jgi:hypothetical protein
LTHSTTAAEVATHSTTAAGVAAWLELFTGNGDLPEFDAVAQACIAKFGEVPVAASIEHVWTPTPVDGWVLYSRKASIDAGTFVLTRTHRYAHVLHVMEGEAIVRPEFGGAHLVQAPSVFQTLAGTKRFIFAITPSIWATTHLVPAELEGRPQECLDYIADDWERVENEPQT